MKDKQYDPARNNEKAPQKGMAAVNTFNEGEEKNINTEENKLETDDADDDKNVPAATE